MTLEPLLYQAECILEYMIRTKFLWARQEEVARGHYKRLRSASLEWFLDAVVVQMVLYRGYSNLRSHTAPGCYHRPIWEHRTSPRAVRVRIRE